MVHYKLYYFPVRARAEPIRLIFHYAGVQFEDFRIPPTEWPNHKQKMKYHQMPVLEVDGVQIPQSNAICRYLGRKFGLAGTGDWEKAQVDALVDFVRDFYSEIGPLVAILLGVSQGNKEAAINEHYLPAAEKAFPVLKKYLRDAGNGFFFKGGVTYADFILVEIFDLLNKGVPNFYDDNPEFKNHVQKIYGLPQLQKYITSRT